MIFQEFNLIERLSVMDNVLTGRLGYTGTLRSLLRMYTKDDIAPGAGAARPRRPRASTSTSAPTASPAASGSASASPAR